MKFLADRLSLDHFNLTANNSTHLVPDQISPFCRPMPRLAHGFVDTGYKLGRGDLMICGEGGCSRLLTQRQRVTGPTRLQLPIGIGTL